jgi:hypothetical protein
MVILAVLGVGCERTPTPPPPAEETKPQAGPQTVDLEARMAERRKAHTATLERARPLVETVMAKADPAALWELQRGELRPPLLTTVSLSNSTRDRDEASTELGDIEADYLDPTQRVQHLALSTGLHRVEQAAGGKALTRRDPLVGAHEARTLLDRVEFALATGNDEDLAAAIDALEVAIRVYHKDVGAASKASLTAAAQDFEAVARRAEALGRDNDSLAAATKKLAETARALSTQISAQLEALPEEPNFEWSKWPLAAGGQPKLQRLPDVLGKAALRNRLEIEEGLERDPVEAVPQLLKLTERLDEIASGQGLDSVASSSASKVTAERCEAALTRIHEKLPQKSAVECEGFLRVWDGATMSDAELNLKLMDVGWVTPARLERRRSAPDWIALLSGRSVPVSHRLLTEVSLAIRLEDKPTLAVAHRRIQDAVCMATAAVWIHAELPQPDKLETWLASDCPGQEPAQWIDAVKARPRDALDGIALALAASGPQGAGMLGFVPWAPLGIVPPYTDPFRKGEAPKEQFDVVDLGKFLEEE